MSQCCHTEVQRGDKMATIRKRGDYQWQVMIRRKGHADQTKTFETKESAVKWARMIEGEIDRGVFVSRDRSLSK
jgi:hypothetical protein